MPLAALQRFRATLAADQPVFGVWVTLEAPSVSEIATGLGFDWIAIDLQCSAIDWAGLAEHIRATTRSNTIALVRLPDADPGLIRRALGLGADGLLIPDIRTSHQYRALRDCARGAVVGRGYEPLMIPLIAEADAEGAADELLGVDGPEILFFHPTASSGTSAVPNPTPTTGGTHVDRALRATLRRGKHAGILAGDEPAVADYRQRGFRMLGLGVDAAIISRQLHSLLALFPSNSRPASFVPPGVNP